MRAEELRIGNLVLGIYEDEDGKTLSTVCKVLSVDETESLGDGWGALLHSVDELEIEEYTDHKPIPITEDWLKRFGFKRQNNALNGPHKNDFSLWNPPGESEFTFNDTVMCPKIEYVHQLQNLYFALTGNELTINK